MKTNYRNRQLLVVTILSFFAVGSALAGSGTWLTSPVNGNWNSAPNWSSMAVPNGPADTATFDSSSISDVSISANTQVNGIVFSPLAQLTPFTITAAPTRTLTVSGVGITNNSGLAQNFVTAVDASGTLASGTLVFKNKASAGSMTALTNNGVTSNGPSGNFVLGGETDFFDTSTASSAMINNIGSAAGNTGQTGFRNSSTAANADINNNPASGDESGPNVQSGLTFFGDTATAGNATIHNNVGTVRGEFAAFGGFTDFFNKSTAGSATITNNGAVVSDIFGGVTQFFGEANAGNATIIRTGATNGATTLGLLAGGTTSFADNSSAGTATLIANGGSDGGDGGLISFFNESSGGTARVEVFGNGRLDISEPHIPGVTIGSIEGTGNVFLGANRLTVGSNQLSTIFSGVIQDGGLFSNAVGGSLTKIGTGTLTLSGANTYTGDTSINAGVLRVDGSIASTNTVVNRGGTLGGTGTIGGNLRNAGIVAPGDSRGTLHVGGNYSQVSGGVLDIEIASLFSFDQLMVSGAATLGGTLDVTLDGYTGHAGDMFPILTSSGLSGNFSMLDLPTLSDGLFFTERVTSKDVLLTVNSQTGVPDQGSTLLLMAGALAALLGLQRAWPCLK